MCASNRPIDQSQHREHTASADGALLGRPQPPRVHPRHKRPPPPPRLTPARALALIGQARGQAVVAYASTHPFHRESIGAHRTTHTTTTTAGIRPAGAAVGGVQSEGAKLICFANSIGRSMRLPSSRLLGALRPACLPPSVPAPTLLTHQHHQHRQQVNLPKKESQPCGTWRCGSPRPSRPSGSARR